MNRTKGFIHWLLHFVEGHHGPVTTHNGRTISHRGACAAKIINGLGRDYPDPSFALPRGAISRVAKELHCSRSYASKVARDNGYHVSGIIEVR